MTQIKCPNCSSLNVRSAGECSSCSMPFSNLPRSAFIVTDTEARTFHSHDYAPFHSPLSREYAFNDPNETGRKTFFWYRVYCGSMAALYLFVAAMGLFISYMAPEMGKDATENAILGLAYAVIGAIFFAIFLVAASLPPRSYNWIVGIVMMAIGMTSCCTWPAVIPLLIYWIKPETRSFFGRN